MMIDCWRDAAVVALESGGVPIVKMAGKCC